MRTKKSRKLNRESKRGQNLARVQNKNRRVILPIFNGLQIPHDPYRDRSVDYSFLKPVKNRRGD